MQRLLGFASLAALGGFVACTGCSGDSSPPPSAAAAGQGGSAGAAGAAGKAGKGAAAGVSGGGGAGLAGWLAWARDDSAWELAPFGDIYGDACTAWQAKKERLPTDKPTWTECGPGCTWARTTELDDGEESHGRLASHGSFCPHRTPTGAGRTIVRWSRFAKLANGVSMATTEFVDAATGELMHATRGTSTPPGNVVTCAAGWGTDSALWTTLSASSPDNLHPEFRPRLSLTTGLLEWGGKPQEYPGGEAFFLDATGQLGGITTTSLLLTADPKDNTTYGAVETYPGDALKAPAAESDTVVWGRAHFPPGSTTFVWDLMARKTKTITANPGLLLAPWEIGAISLGDDLVAGLATRPSDKAVTLFWLSRTSVENGIALPTIHELPQLKGTTPLAIRTWGGWIALQYRVEVGSPPRERIAIFDTGAQAWRTLKIPEGWTSVRYGVSLDASAVVLGLLLLQPPILDTDGSIRRLMRIERSALDSMSVGGFVP